MMLVGQYDSPFVRRAAIALHHHGVTFDRKVISTFAHFDDNLTINPLGKVPTLVLSGGESIYDSRWIIEYVEAKLSSGAHSLTADDVDLVRMMQIEAIGVGLAEKTYERGIEFSRRAPGSHDPIWIERLERQIASALAWLSKHCDGAYFVSGRLSRADLAVGTALTFLSEKLPQLYSAKDFPKLETHRAACEALSVFKAAAYSKAEAVATGWRPEDGRRPNT